MPLFSTIMTSRYYDEKDDDIQPGKISAELRAALNLADNDVPIWIYRMRALGYPPGWLNKAIVDTSDIFDTDPEPTAPGKRKGPPDDSERAAQPQYDHSKLIEYPGFNTPLPPNTQDYHYYYNMPPMLPHQQLDYAKKTMSAFKPTPVPVIPSAKRAKTTESSSEEEEEDDDNGEEGSSGEEEEDGDSPDGSKTTNGEQDASKTSKRNNNNISNNTHNQSSASLNSTLSEGIKLVSKGSPMPKPVERLPLERFSEGVVGELLYFENIPNSTGAFDSLRGLLNTMRQSRSSDTTDQSFAGETSTTSATGPTTTQRTPPIANVKTEPATSMKND